ncbi:tyrosine-type recombinase/integrase [Microseira sp. BLCC-F43]|jgi:integrase/recombinase XerD|uniref:tyrosine-type recombinase/integrase n=1 Tax=Microseira sp. BLCC-F43 TaxID=3153602 RepID=UPI0035BB06CC
MPKICRHGQAQIISESEYLKIRRVLNGWHQLFWDIAYYTGERWGAIVALRVDDVYLNSRPLEYITFRARTRKADPSGRRQTRQVPVHPVLNEKLQAYKIPASEWLFPSNSCKKKGNHVSFKTADAFLRVALEKTGYQAKGISTHSTRRSLITHLDERGIGIKLTLPRLKDGGFYKEALQWSRIRIAELYTCQFPQENPGRGGQSPPTQSA